MSSSSPAGNTASLPDSRTKFDVVRRALPNRLVLLVGVLAAVLGFFATSGTASADLHYEMRVKVNLTVGSTTTKAQAQAKQAGINDILKQCDTATVKYRVTIVPVTSTKQGQNVTDAQDTDLLKWGEKEVDGNGYKITMINSYSGNINGQPGNNVNGTTLRVNPPTTPVHPASNVKDGTDATTWAHEIGHGLGLPDLSGAGEKNRIMYGTRNQRTGTVLTAAECDVIRQNFAARAKGKLDWLQRLSQTVDKIINKLLSDVWGDTGYAPVDLHAPSVIFDWRLDDRIYFNIGVGPFPSPPTTIDSHYYLGFDTDGSVATGRTLNEGTGATLGAYPGFEYRAHVHATGQAPFTLTGSLERADPGGWTQVSTPAVALSSLDRQVALESGSDPAPQNLGQELSLDIAMAQLGTLASQPRVAALAVSSPYEDEAAPETVNLQPASPTLTLDPLRAKPGETVGIQGSGYAPSSTIDLILGDQILTPAATDGSGSFNASRQAPSLSTGGHLLDAIDQQGSLALEVLTLLGPGGGIVEPLEPANLPPEAVDSGAGRAPYVFGAAAAAGLLALGAGALYARRRRWFR